MNTQEPAPPKQWAWMGYIACAVLVVLILGGMAMWKSDVRLILEKMATAAVMPYSLATFGCLVLCFVSVRRKQRWAAAVAGVCFLLLYIFGNSYVADFLLRSLENEFADIQPLQQAHYDVVVVLGGGTNEGRNGVPQGHLGGDRMLLAARMYHAGLIQDLYCTGNRIESISAGDVWQPWEEAHLILQDLGVPAERLHHLEGRNTSEEMRSLGTQMASSEARIGLITSAWHLKRASRLARRNGMQVDPLPCDFYSSPEFAFNPLGIVPTGIAAHFNQVVFKEYLGLLVGR